MRKRIVSLMIAAIMLFGILPAYALDASELTVAEQSFAGLTEAPGGWTLAGVEDTNYVFNTDSIGVAAKKNAYVKASLDTPFDTKEEPYKVTFALSHYSNGASLVHIASKTADEARSDAACDNGYSIRFTPTSDYKKAVIKIFKNGEEIGTLEDKGSNYQYHQSLRTFEFSVSDKEITLTGAKNSITIEDTEPIYSGYLGFVLKDSNNGGKSKLASIKLNKLLMLSGSSIEGSQGITEDIELEFSYPLDAETVNQTNIYITDEEGNAISKSDYSVTSDSNTVKISFNVNLEYTKNYNVVIEKDLCVEGTKVGLASQTTVPFITEDPPFYVKCTADGNTLNIKIGNTIYESQDFKLFIKATDEDGNVLGKYAYPVTMPEMGSTFDLSETVAEDLTAALIEVYAVAEDNTPLLDDFFKLDKNNNTTVADIFANRLKDEAKTEVSEKMSANEYTDIDTLYMDFVKTVVTAAVSGWSEDGFNHIEDVLLANGDFLDLELSAYSEAVDKSEMNEYIYNYGVKTFEDVQKAIDEAVINTDRAYYTHTFSKEDATVSDWNFYVKGSLDNTLTENTYGVVFSDTSGVYLPKTAVAEVISKFEVSGNYEISGTFSRAYNDLIYYFSYTDSNNWCRVKFSYSNDSRQSTTVQRSVDGSVKTYATIDDGSAYSRKIIVEEDGYVTVKNTSDETVIERTYLGAPLDSGKVGFGLHNATGYIRTVNILTYLKAEADVQRDNVSVDTDSINVKFNYNVKPATVTKDTVRVFETEKQIESYEIEPESDGSGFEIVFTSPLKYKSKYDIKISDKVKVAFGKSKFFSEQTISFNTEKPPFNVSEFYGKYGDEDVFINDMSTVDEVYTAVSKLTDLAGKDIEITLKAESDLKESAVVVFELSEENGKVWYNSGFLPVTVDPNNVLTKTVTIPEDINDNAKFSYYVFDSEENLYTKYPFTQIKSAGQGAKPNVYKNENTVKVWGTAPGKAEGKNINLVLQTEQEKIVLKTASSVTDKDGNYSFEFEINTEMLTKSDYVNVNISGQEYEKVVGEKIYAAVLSDRNTAVREINNSKDTKQAIEDNAHILDIKSLNQYGVALYENLSDTELLSLTELVEAQKPYNETDNGKEFLRAVFEFMVLIHYNSENSELLYSEDGEFLTADIINFKTLEETKNAYEIYSENLKEAGRSLVREGILNKDYESVEDLSREFVRSVIVSGINNWSVNGYGHIYKLLTENADAAELDITKYENLEKRTTFEKTLLNDPVSDFEELEERISDIKTSSGSGTGSSSGSGSGKSTPKGNFGIVSVQTDTETPHGFSDISTHPWAQDAILYLTGKGIVNGFEDNTFRPANTIKREEFATLIVRAFGFTDTGEKQGFSDVAEGAWYTPYIYTAQSNKLIEGYNGIFGTGTFLTRQDAVVILKRALTVKGYSSESAEISVENYSDADEIADYAYEAFSEFVSGGIINGLGNNTLAPRANCSRAEMAVMLYNVLMRYN